MLHTVKIGHIINRLNVIAQQVLSSLDRVRFLTYLTCSGRQPFFYTVLYNIWQRCCIDCRIDIHTLQLVLLAAYGRKDKKIHMCFYVPAVDYSYLSKEQKAIPFEDDMAATYMIYY